MIGDLCPQEPLHLNTEYRSTPAWTIRVAHVCRRSWKWKSVILAFFRARWRLRLILLAFNRVCALPYGVNTANNSYLSVRPLEWNVPSPPGL
jgi:hypothetical protein